MEHQNIFEVIYRILVPSASIIFILYMVFSKRSSKEIISTSLSIFLLFSMFYISEFSKFKITTSGLDAELRDQIGRASASIEQIQNLAVILTKTTLEPVTTWELSNQQKEKVIGYGEDIEKYLKELNLDDSKINYAMSNYYQQIEYSLFQDVKRSACNVSETNDADRNCKIDFSKISLNPVDSSENIRKFILKYEQINENTQKSLYELDFFQKNHRINDKEHFIRTSPW